MKIKESKELTAYLLKKYDLSIYDVEVFMPNDQAIIDYKITKNTIAYCDSSKYKMRLSVVYMLALSKKRVYDIVIHEIAHALDHRKNGSHNVGSHGFTWQLLAAKLGVEPKPLLKLTPFETFKVDFYRFIYELRIFF